MLRTRASAKQSSLPVARLLAELFKTSYPRKRNTSARHKIKSGISVKDHTDVVGKKLCDDIIEYLAPTLEKHKGCTLIDFFPGPCVWSSRLHDFLRPKKHLLIEPDDRYFEAFIKPLLDKPGSAYQHTAVEKQNPHTYLARWMSIEQSTGLFPEETAGLRGKADVRSLNPNVLVTGNWARRFKAQKGIQADQLANPRRILPDLTWRTTFNDAFHSSGLVRMLGWFPEEVKAVAFATRLAHRGQRTVGIEATCALTEIAGVTPFTEYAGIDSKQASRHMPSRWSGFDVVAERQVSERMKAASIVVPKKRKLLAPLKPSDLSEDDLPTSPFEPVTDTPSELRRSIDTCAERLRHITPAALTERARGVKASSAVQEIARSITHKYVAAAMMRSVNTNLITKDGSSFYKIVAVADVAVQLINLEANFKRIEEKYPDEAGLEEMRQEIISLGDRVHLLTQAQSGKGCQEIEDFIDEHIAFFSSGTTIARNARNFETLKAETTDFWPTKPLTLIDLTPHSLPLAVPDLADQAQAARLFYMIIQSIFRSRRTPVVVALDRMAINAGKDLVPMCPTLMDVRKGGRLNLKHLRVRQLTGEMLEELTKAFFEWPFRPLNWEMSFTSALNESVGPKEAGKEDDYDSSDVPADLLGEDVGDEGGGMAVDDGDGDDTGEVEDQDDRRC